MCKQHNTIGMIPAFRASHTVAHLHAYLVCSTACGYRAVVINQLHLRVFQTEPHHGFTCIAITAAVATPDAGSTLSDPLDDDGNCPLLHGSREPFCG